MIPSAAAVRTAIDALTAPAPIAPAPLSAGADPVDHLLTLATARPWRRSGVDADTRADARRKIAAALSAGDPIEFSVPFGGSKGFRQPGCPRADWAEVFWLAYLRAYGARLAAAHAPGVVVSLSYFSGMLDFINGLTPADQGRYIADLALLCAAASGDGVGIRLVDLSEAYGGAEAARAEIESRYLALRAAESPPVAEGSLRSAARNLPGEAAPDMAAARAAALRCAAMEGLEKRRAFNKFSSRIQITHIRGTSLALHLGTCQTSIMQPWVGTGILEPDGAGGLRPRILNAAGRTDLVAVAAGHPLADRLPALGMIPVAHG